MKYELIGIGVPRSLLSVPLSLSIGIVLQDSSDGLDLSVKETLSSFTRYYSNPRKVDELIAAVGSGRAWGEEWRGRDWKSQERS